MTTIKERQQKQEVRKFKLAVIRKNQISYKAIQVKQKMKLKQTQKKDKFLRDNG